jgi:exonuclease SbcC
VKPLRLSVEGFTSFRDRVEIDFAGLDLFAITGPTGAGKSSLIDAIVFALYGQVPRVGDDYKQLISQGEDRLSVLFEFGVGDERYRIVRTARRAGASQQRLERRGANAWDPIADRVREIRAEVDRVLGLDYEGFTRSVVLPQGQFDAFLKGEPKERRKILVALLGLGVYERMLQLANQRAAAARSESEFIRKQLETDFAGATPEALGQRRSELASAEAEAKRAEAALDSLARGAELAQQVRAGRRDGEALARDEAEEEKRRTAAETTLDGASARRAALESDIEALRQRIGCLDFDADRHASLVEAKPRSEQLAALRPRLERAEKAAAEQRRAVDEALASIASLEAELPRLEQGEAAAREGEAAAREAREVAHREHAAAALRRGLKPGDACPVCAQPVKTVPAGEAPAIEAAEARARGAEAEARAAADRFQQRRLKLGEVKARSEGLARELARLEEQRAEMRSLVETLAGELGRAGFARTDTADAAGLVDLIQSELVRLEAARQARTDLEARRQEIEGRRAGLEAAVAAATAQRDAARERLVDLVARRGEACRRQEEALRSLLALACREGWNGLDAPPQGRDEADVVETLRAARQRASSETAASVARLSQAVATLESALVRAAELRERREALERDGALHKSLADHLRADALVAWIQEEALRHLAGEGSRHLLKLSQERYELRLGSGEEAAARVEQEFFVVDRWNDGEGRSVKTLSGGETFLASLALALALAEGLAQLSAEGQASVALESLFLDEGFGALDREALDVVVSALDELHGGQRLVGIVTHVRELAERLPARLEVSRQGRTAVATIV